MEEDDSSRVRVDDTSESQPGTHNRERQSKEFDKKRKIIQQRSAIINCSVFYITFCLVLPIFIAARVHTDLPRAYTNV